ncbi:hypothetical protein EJ995_01345 [Nonlabens ponticola]|uniref:Uncharacterized protein n=1 Tax=Nonlabens ponticola TaxID=2496866 RepID=A0A3S9N180_9FLAO|nr:hypothetical protein EJ995_01345 [Nonlabens ponticola]
MTGRQFITIVLSCLAILLVPFIAMQFTDEVNWSLMDFVVAFLLFFTGSVTIQIIRNKLGRKGYRSFVFIFVVVILLALVWVELAVGIFGSPVAGS